jgi:glycosyltransferase involved in cell wall biosynthesis
VPTAPERSISSGNDPGTEAEAPGAVADRVHRAVGLDRRACPQELHVPGPPGRGDPEPDRRDHFHADRHTLRRELSIPEDALALCVSAVNFTNYFKGTEILTEALTAVWNSVDDATRSRIRVVAIGGGADALADAQPFPCSALGQLDGDAAVAKAYQAADMFVCPSRAENGVQTIPEALLTGTPVVSFPVGGAADVIEHGVNGYLAAQGSAADLAEGIRTFLARAGDSAVAAAARAAGLRHARATVAATHVALCDELVAAHRAPVTTRRPVTPAG